MSGRGQAFGKSNRFLVLVHQTNIGLDQKNRAGAEVLISRLRRYIVKLYIFFEMCTIDCILQFSRGMDLQAFGDIYPL